MMELSERLSYYGINQGLKNFMQKIGWRLVSASALKSTRTSIDYITPIFGVYLADGEWGCFRTILTFGICHCIGDFLVAIAAYPNIMTKEVVVNLSGAVVVTGPFLLLFSLVVNVASSFSADNGRAVESKGGEFDGVQVGSYKKLVSALPFAAYAIIWQCASSKHLNDILWAAAIANYVFITLAEILINVTAYDVFYSVVPIGLKSTSQSVNLVMASVGSVMMSVFIVMFSPYLPTDDLNDGNFEHMFFAMGAASLVNLFAFYFTMKKMIFGRTSSTYDDKFDLQGKQSVASCHSIAAST
ncbi:hypothetical protein PRIC1_002847 [Phytophthora ramorum]